jgi:hypothetical protein
LRCVAARGVKRAMMLLGFLWPGLRVPPLSRKRLPIFLN